MSSNASGVRYILILLRWVVGGHCGWDGFTVLYVEVICAVRDIPESKIIPRFLACGLRLTKYNPILMMGVVPEDLLSLALGMNCKNLVQMMSGQRHPFLHDISKSFRGIKSS